jgi:hypothetical protein
MTSNTPTQKIQTWINNFVTKPNPVFGNLPPCPFAQKAMVDQKVKFVELDGTVDYEQLCRHIGDCDFNEKDVLVLIAQPVWFTATQTQQLAEQLNNHFMDKDIVVLEDHPDIKESVKGVSLNNGEYILFLVQRLSKLNRFAKMLESGPYYDNWSTSYLESVKGWRSRK